MMLVEQTTVPVAALPVGAFKDHLRLGTGFADDAVQDGVLETCLRASLSAIEARCGKAVLRRGFRWTVTAWRDLQRQALPLAPVTEITRLAITDRTGQETPADPAHYVLRIDTHRPAVVSTGVCLPAIPVGGHAEIDFLAGFAPDWDTVPADLRHAVLTLAAHFYENRNEMGASDGLPPAVNALLMPYMNVRLFGGLRS